MAFTKCWLAYPEIRGCHCDAISLHTELTGETIDRAKAELAEGFKGLYGAALTEGDDITLALDMALDPEGYRLKAADGHCTIEGGSEVGVLYGVFALLRNLQTAGKAWAQFTADEEKAPSNRLRMLNHWDNMDGSIERGYSGDSFFFKDSEILIDVPRLTAYARMLASVGINGITINNVNVKDAASWLITDRYFGALQEYLKIFTPYGVKLYLSINFAAPMELGGMDSADPCDPAVAKWWADKAQEVWANLPGLGGFLVKADSEGRPGPFTYGRNQADGANMLADAVAPCGGHIVWRCFVYNCQQDWRNTKIDRARAGYDYFMPLDGTFRDNVTLQIKNGPMDFQVREPVSPLIGGLQHTHIAVEFQIAQEYTGQQRHVCYLMPWFRQILDFDMHTRPNGDAHVRALIQGAGNGMVAVTNTGNDENWTGHDLAAANLYGFGRLSYDTTLDPAVIAGEWLRLTFGNNEPVEKTLHRSPGPPMKNTTPPWAWAGWSTPTTTTAPMLTVMSTAAGAATTAPPSTALALIARPRAAITATSTPPNWPKCTPMWRPAPKSCCSSSTTCRTTMCSRAAKRSCSTSTTPTSRVPRTPRGSTTRL